MEPHVQKRKCVDCDSEFEAYDVYWEGRAIFQQKRCEICIEAAQRVNQADVKAAHIERQRQIFAAICPPLYQDTNPAKLHPKLREVVRCWQYGPCGLGLVGTTGIGKTRAAYWLLKRMAALDRSIQATNAVTFAKLCVDQFSADRECKVVADRAIQSIRRAHIWLLDDLGKQRMTERGEVELYEVLEYRAARNLPVIWTSNNTGETLAAKFSEERSGPIMRRLIQFNRIIEVWENENCL